MQIRSIQHTSVPRPPGHDAHARAVAFYAGILGLHEIPKPATFGEIDVTWFRIGNQELHLYAAGPDQPLPHSEAHFCLEVSSLQAARDLLEQSGVACHEPTPIPNRPRFVAHDPFGNQIEFTSIEGDYLGAEEPNSRNSA